MDCRAVEETGLVARYLAGTLAEQEAEAFEAHYFGCEECWRALAAAQALRAAAPPPARPRVRVGTPAALAVAAALVLGLLAAWPIARGRFDAEDTPAFRGPDAPLALRLTSAGGRSVVEWSALPEAHGFLVEVQTADGVPVLQRRVGETRWVVEAEALRQASPAPFYVSVRALDAWGEVLAESGPQRLLP